MNKEQTIFVREYALIEIGIASEITMGMPGLYQEIGRPLYIPKN